MAHGRIQALIDPVIEEHFNAVFSRTVEWRKTTKKEAIEEALKLYCLVFGEYKPPTRGKILSRADFAQQRYEASDSR